MSAEEPNAGGRRRGRRPHGQTILRGRYDGEFELGIGRLNLQTAPENLASQPVAERAGFTREGLLRAWLPTADGRRDSVMFSLLPP